MLRYQLVLVAVIATLQLAYGWTGDDITQAVTDNDQNKLAVILGEKTHPDITDKLGWTGLLTAARTQNVGAAQRLLDAGANVNLAERDGWTPLHFSVAFNNAPLCHLLIESGADILQKNKKGQFPLAAVEEGNNEQLKRVFAEALNKNKNSQAAAPKQQKQQQQEQKQPAKPQAAIPSYDDVFARVRQGNLLAFREAINAFGKASVPYDFNHKDAAGFTLAHCICAAQPVNPEMFKYLMSGRQVNLNVQENDGWTPLMFLAVHVSAVRCCVVVSLICYSFFLVCVCVL